MREEYGENLVKAEKALQECLNVTEIRAGSDFIIIKDILVRVSGLLWQHEKFCELQKQ